MSDTVEQSKKKVYLNNGGPAAFMAIFLWGVWAASYFFKFDVIGLLKRNKPEIGEDMTPLYLAMAILFTVGGAIYTIVASRKELRLTSEGIRAEATITSKGFGMSHMESVTYEYVISGASYSNKISAVQGIYSVGQKVPILVDPTKHSSSILVG